MKAETDIAHCFIKYFMIANEFWCHIFEINNYLILLVKKPEVDTNKNKKKNHTKKKMMKRNNLLYSKMKQIL